MEKSVEPRVIPLSLSWVCNQRKGKEAVCLRATAHLCLLFIVTRANLGASWWMED